jgi:hypothetical protein
MSDPNPPLDTRAQALAYCNERITFYQGVGIRNYSRWKIIGAFVIILGAIGTALSAITTANLYWLPAARVAAVAGTTILSSLLTFFSFQKEGVRQMVTADLLKGELIKFETQAAPYNTAAALSDFVNNVRAIVTAENQAFASVMLSVGSGNTQS